MLIYKNNKLICCYLVNYYPIVEAMNCVITERSSGIGSCSVLV